MMKHTTNGAFAKAVARARAARLSVIATRDGGWFVQSQDGLNSYLVWFDTRAGEWRCPCKATVMCIHCGTAFLASQEARQATEAAQVAARPTEARLLRHDNTGPRWTR